MRFFKKRTLNTPAIVKEEKKDKNLVDSKKVVEEYLNQSNWRVKENANMSYAVQWLNNFIASKVSAKYWLSLYPEEISTAHREWDLHLHDLAMLGNYCCWWDLKDLLIRWFWWVSEKPQSAPPKHLRSALWQIVNFLYTLQWEANWAQAVASFDTFLAPFVRYDWLDYKWVKQAIQEFVFNMNVPTRVGFQTVFSNITLDVTPSSEIAEQNIIIGWEIKNEKYWDFQKEMDMINKAFGQVMLEWDSTWKPFSFPIPTYNVDKDFPWDKECLEPIFKATAKYWIPYFANFVSTWRSKDETRSMCCFSWNTKTVVNVRWDEIQITLEKLSRRISPFKIWNWVEWKDAKSVVVDYNDRLLDVKCENWFVYSMTKNHLNYVKESNWEKIVVATDLKEWDELPYYTWNEIVYSKIASISEWEFASKAYCVEVQWDNPKFMLFWWLLTHNCRLSLDLTEIKKRGGWLFWADALTGSIWVVTINMARLGYIAKNEEDYINKLYRLMDLAKDSLEIKRDLLEKYMEWWLYPYSKHYLDWTKRRFGKYWANHFSTIWVNWMNESLINFFGKDIASEEWIEFTTKIMNLMNDRLRMYQEETWNLYNLEASPAEWAWYRFALSDKEKYPKIICANEPAYRKWAKPFYTNSTHVPVDYTDDLFTLLDKQNDIQSLYSGWTVVHAFLWEKVDDIDNVKKLIKTIFSRYKLPYLSITPTFSICQKHGYLPWEQHYCPKCEAEDK